VSSWLLEKYKGTYSQITDAQGKTEPVPRFFHCMTAKSEDMLTADLEASIMRALPLTINDIQLTVSETELYRRCMIHTVLHVIVKHGGDGFQALGEGCHKNPARDYRQDSRA